MTNQSKITYNKILAKANELYAEAKLGKDWAFKAPELRPTIQSDQVKSLLQAMLEFAEGDDE